ncbi:SIR2 NAD-dependent histone deacetylase SIR2 [Candida maltosa Xu316]
MLNDSSFKPPREEESSEDDEDSFDSDSDSTTTTTTTTTTTRNSTPIYKRPKETPFKYTLPDFISGLSLANRIMVVTGAGISTSLGIPDFRSFKGLYNQLSKLNLSDPQKVFDLATFMEEPGLFYSIAHMVLPPEGKFALLHAFLKIIQDKGKLLRNYTQNIDNLEERAGIYPDKLIQCHGSFSHARCITCNSLFAGTKIYDHIRKQQIPRCSQCWKDLQEAPLIHGVIKPTITFFGEDLPERYHNNIKSDIRNCDMCIVIGTSLNVNPVAGIIKDIPFDVPKILINKDPIEGMGAFFNLKLYGLCDEVVSYVSKCLGDDWFIPHADHNPNSHFSAVMDNNGTYRIKKLR